LGGVIGDYVYFGVDVANIGKHINIQPINSPLIDSDYGTVYRHYTGQASGIVWAGSLTPFNYVKIDSAVRQLAPSSWGQGLHANITADFNSGYQYGDIKGCWLADTVAGSVVGGNVFPIGNFASSTGWTLQTGWSITGTSAVLSTTTTVGLYADAAFYLTVGKHYTVTIDVTAVTGAIVFIHFL